MNRTIKYLLNNKKQNAGVITVFSLIMVIQLLLTSELWYEYFPSGKEALSQACYSYKVEDVDKTVLANLMTDYPKGIVKPSDVQLAGTGVQDHPELISEHVLKKDDPEYKTLLQDTEDISTETIRIYAPITEFSENRINDKGSYEFSRLGNDSIVLLPVKMGIHKGERSGFEVGKYLYVLNNSLNIVGVADIYEVKNEEYPISFEYIGNTDTVLRLTSEYEIIYQFEKPLSSEEEQLLESYMAERFSVTDISKPYVIEQNRLDSLERLTIVSILGIILCFWLTIEFIWYLLELRQKEFRVYQICGAGGKYITKLILIHISVLCFISECMGWAVFGLLYRFTRLIQLESIHWAFALINILFFWIIAILVVSVNLAIESIEKRKLGISRTAR